MTGLSRRVGALEAATSGPQVAVTYAHPGEPCESAAARWEADHEPIGNRLLVVIDRLDAAQ